MVPVLAGAAGKISSMTTAEKAEKKRAYDRARYAANKEKKLAAAKERYWANPEKAAEYGRHYRVKYRDRLKARKHAWHAANAAQVRDRRLRATYGISAEDYDARLLAQGGGCAICQNDCPTGRMLAVDHDHATGVVRGLLCTNCNMAVGKMKDDADLLRRAAEYLDAA